MEKGEREFSTVSKLHANSHSIKSHFILHSKRGMSPLIATVLLIAFAVALGVMVMNWGKSAQPIAPVAGTDIKVNAYALGDKTLLCFDPAAYNLRPESAQYKICAPDEQK